MQRWGLWKKTLGGHRPGPALGALASALVLVAGLVVLGSVGAQQPDGPVASFQIQEAPPLVEEDFALDPNAGSDWRFYRSGSASTSGYWDPGGLLYLTKAAGSQAVAVFSDQPLTGASWRVEFDYLAGGGSGADGLVFMFYKDESSYLGGAPGGGGLAFKGAGYAIEFDNYYNGGCDPNEHHIALVQDSVCTILAYASDTRTEDNTWHRATITYDHGLIVVAVDQDEVLRHQIVNPDETYSGFGFGAATGGATNNHIIDNVSLRLTNGYPTLHFVDFVDASEPAGDIQSWSWDFGDGVSQVLDAGGDTSHAYADPGFYSACLTVLDSAGIEDQTCLDVLIVNRGPSAAFGLPLAPQVGQVVAFSDQSVDPDGSIASWDWRFGDGGASTLRDPTHTFSSVGVHEVCLLVTDDAGASDVLCQDVEVAARSLVAAFSADLQEVSTGDAIQFTDQSTGSGSIVSWQWDFGDGTSSTLRNPSHAYSATGEHVVSLTVEDDLGDSATATGTVNVANVAPSPGFVWRPVSVVAGDVITFTDASSDADGEIASRQWNLGDGTIVDDVLGLEHTFAAGEYPVSLLVTDDYGTSRATGATLVAHPRAFDIELDLPAEVEVNRRVEPGADVPGATRWEWDFGDGKTSAEAAPATRWSQPGTYRVTLTAWSDAGVGSVQREITVVTAPLTVAMREVPAQVLSLEPVRFIDDSYGGEGPLSYSWDFGDRTQGHGAEAEHSYRRPGDYPVTLTVSDQAEQAKRATGQVVGSIEVTNRAPLAGIGLPDGAVAHVGENLTLEDVSTDLDGHVEQRRWRFGDGTRGAAAVESHNWTKIGIFNVELAARDNRLAIGTTQTNVTTYVRFEGSGDAADPAFQNIGVRGLAEILFASPRSANVDITGRVAGGPAAFEEEGVPAYTGPGQALRYLEITPEAGHDGDALRRVTIRLAYSDAEFERLGLSEAEVTLLYWNGTAWIDLLTGPNDRGVIHGSTPERNLRVFQAGRDTGANLVWATVNHTSHYAVAAPPGNGPVYGGGGGGGGGGGAGAASSSSASTSTSDSKSSASSSSSSSSSSSASGAGAGAGGAGGGGGGGGLQAAPELRVGSGGASVGSGGTIRGVVDITLEGAGVEDVAIYAVGEDGSVVWLGDGSSTQWNTTDLPNGRYRLEARSAGAESDGSTATYRVHASRVVIVNNPRAELGEAVTAIAVGVGIVAGGSALSSLIMDTVREGAVAMGEDHMRDRTKGVGLRVRKYRRLAAIGAATATLLLLVVFFTIEALDRITWSGYLANLPIVGLAVGVFFAAAYGSEMLLARAGGVRARFRFLLSGALALAFSAGVLRTAFGYPGYVDEEDADGDGADDDEGAGGDAGDSGSREGIRALGALGMVLGLTLPFLALGSLWRWDFGEEGLAVVLTTLASSVLPFKPLPGHDLWRWSKAASLAVLALGFFLFIQFQLAALSSPLLVALSAIGLAGYVATFRWLRATAPPEAAAPAGPDPA